MSYALGPITIAVFFMLEVGIIKPQYFEMYAENWHGFFNGILAFFFGFLFVFTTFVGSQHSGMSALNLQDKWSYLFSKSSFGERYLKGL